jgi:hypothetical protein
MKPQSLSQGNDNEGKGDKQKIRQVLSNGKDLEFEPFPHSINNSEVLRETNLNSSI